MRQNQKHPSYPERHCRVAGFHTSDNGGRMDYFQNSLWQNRRVGRYLKRKLGITESGLRAPLVSKPSDSHKVMPRGRNVAETRSSRPRGSEGYHYGVTNGNLRQRNFYSWQKKCNGLRSGGIVVNRSNPVCTWGGDFSMVADQTAKRLVMAVAGRLTTLSTCRSRSGSESKKRWTRGKINSTLMIVGSGAAKAESDSF